MNNRGHLELTVRVFWFGYRKQYIYRLIEHDSFFPIEAIIFPIENNYRWKNRGNPDVIVYQEKTQKQNKYLQVGKNLS